MNRKVIYTCIVGGYDDLRQPLVVADDYDYICFTDSIVEPNVGVWRIRSIPFKSRNKVLLSRYPKIMPHIVLPEYEYSVYMDANIQIVEKSFYDYVTNRIEDSDLISQVPHTYRNCIYQEIYACWYHNMISILSNIWLRHRYHKIGMPKNYGLFENNIILRKHNDPFVKKVSIEWWQNIKNGLAKRDQLYLMPIYWKQSYLPSLLFGDKRNVRNISCMKWIPHLKIRKELKRTHFEEFLMRLSNGAERRNWI